MTRSPFTWIIHVLAVASVLGSVLSTQPNLPTEAAPLPDTNALYTAFHDFNNFNGLSAANVSVFAHGSGALLNFATGLPTGATLDISAGPSWSSFDAGAHPTGGDALSIFGASGTSVNTAGMLDTNTIQPITLTFSNLSDNARYDLVLYSNRAVASGTRLVSYTINSVDTFSNTSSTGATFSGPADPTTVIDIMLNSAPGLVARFSDIDPGPDGQFTVVVANAGGSNQAVQINALRLQLTNPSPLIFVTTTTDELNNDGDCSLREAVRAANTDTAVDACTAGSGADTVTLPAGVYTITLAGANEDANATGDFDITGTLTLVGAGAGITLINANGLDRAFEVLGAGVAGVTVQNLTVQNGVAAKGGGFNATRPLTLTNVHVLNSVGTPGGGLNVELAPGVIIGGLFQNNRCVGANCLGGGAYFDAGGVITGTRFISNTAGRGGGMGIGNGRVVNALFARNTSTGGTGDGAAIYVNASTDIWHTTIASTSPVTQSAIYVLNGSARITNTIVANHAIGIRQAGASTVSQNYTVFFANTANLSGTVSGGANSFTADPQFADPASDNYRLTAASPALDAAQNLGVLTDWEGDPRPLGAASDIGFDEVAFNLIAVTTFEDELNTDGDCSLREAVQAANTNLGVDACPAGGGADDTIVLAAGVYTLTLAGADENANQTGDLDVLSTVALVGVGPEATLISANGLDRAVHGVGTASLTLRNLQVRNGLITGVAVKGAGVYAANALTLDNVHIFNNVGLSTTGCGGGVAADGPATVQASVVYSNYNDIAGGGCFIGPATLLDSTFASNRAYFNGGGAAVYGALTLSDTQFVNNQTTGVGGGGGLFANTVAVLTNATFSGNTTNENNGDDGGGALFYGPATLTGGLFENNVAAVFNGGAGGGLAAGQALTLTGVTFRTNNAAGGGAVSHTGGHARLTNNVFIYNLPIISEEDVWLASPGGAQVLNNTFHNNSGLLVDAGTVTVTNNLFNGCGFCSFSIQQTGGTVTEDYNLFFNFFPNPGIIGTVTSGGNSLSDRDPLLTAEWRPGPASPAVNAGTNTGLTSDFDGQPRPLDGAYDIGADELAPGCFASLGTTTDFSSVSARAVRQAVAAASPGGTVKLAGYCPGVVAQSGFTHTVAVTQPLILAGGYAPTNWLTADPAAHPTTLDAVSGGRVLSITTVPVTVRDLTVTNGLFSPATPRNGAGIAAGGALTLSRVTVSNNTLTSASANVGGGGVFVAGPAWVEASTFSGNNSLNSGGGALFASTAHISGSTFHNNTANTFGTNWDGGGALFEGPAYLTRTNFFTNTAGQGGGATFLGTESHLHTVTFGGNTATDAANGGGGAQFYFAAHVVNSVFSHNTASAHGGGAEVLFAEAFFTNSLFIGNQAPLGGGLFVNDNTSVVHAVNGLWARNTGGAVYVSEADQVRLVHSTFASPTLSAEAAVVVLAGNVALTNTIITSHTVGIQQVGGTATHHHTLFFGNLTNTVGTVGGGAGTRTGDPRFVDVANELYRTPLFSPAMDAGANTGLTFDFQGVVRPQGPAPDLGYAEAPSTAPALNASAGVSLPEDSALIVPFTVSDGESAPETLTVTVQSGNLTLIPFINLSLTGLGTERTLSLRPALNQFGSTVITLSVADGVFTTTHPLAVTITPVNDAPTLSAPGNQTTLEDGARGPIPLTLADPDTAPASLSLSAQSSQPALIPAGNITLAGSGANRTVTLLPLPNQTGSAIITLTVSDGLSATSTLFAFTVAPVNDAPTGLSLSAASLPEDAPLDTLVGTLTVTDPDCCDAHTLTLAAGGPDNGAFALHGNVLHTAALFDFESRATYVIRVRATDPRGLWVERPLTLTILNTNEAPTAHPDAALTVSGQPVSVLALANDTDPENAPLTLLAVGAPAHGTASGQGVLAVYTPTAGFAGVDTFTYTVSDGTHTAHGLVSVLVNPAGNGLLLADDTFTTTEDTPALIPVLDNDPPAFLLYVGATANAEAAVLGQQVLVTPALNFAGVLTLTYGAVNDSLSGLAHLTLTVTPLNDAPHATPDEANTPEGVPVTVTVLANDTDPDGDPLTLVGVNQGLSGTATLVSGAVRYTPRAGLTGVDTLTYAVSDGNGGLTYGTVNVTVLAVNRAPTPAADTLTADEDTPLTVNLLSNDTDPNPGDTLSVLAVTAPQSGTATLLPNGLVRYQPFADYAGPDAFAYVVRDAAGLTGTASVSLTVRPVADIPLANPVVAFTPVGQPLFNINVLDQADNPELCLLGVVSFTQPASATVSLNVDGTFNITPTAGYQGVIDVSYTISDNKTAPNAALAPEVVAGRTSKLTLVVGTVAHDLSAGAGATSTGEGQGAALNPLLNAQGGLGELALIGLQRRLGRASLNADGTVAYTPPPGFVGVDVLTYTVGDGRGGFATATFSVTVNPVTRPPDAQDDVFTVAEDTAITLTVTGNDRNLAGGPLTVTAVSAARFGQTTLNPNGSITFVPAPNHIGFDRFEYALTNMAGGVDVAVVTLVITNSPDAPLAADDHGAGLEDTPLVIAVQANDTDPDGDALTVLTAQPAFGTARVTPVGTIIYTPAPNFGGADSFTYTVRDATNRSATATVFLHTSPVNDAPNALTDTAVVTAGVPVWLEVLANDTDVDSTQLRLVSVQASGGTARLLGNRLQFTAGAGLPRTEVLTYVVADEHGGSSTGTVVLTVIVPDYALFLPMVVR